MQSRGISRKSNTWHFQFSIRLNYSLGEVHFAENPTWIGPEFWSKSNLKILETIENIRNAFLFVAVSNNQCSQLPTDPITTQMSIYTPFKKSLYSNEWSWSQIGLLHGDMLNTNICKFSHFWYLVSSNHLLLSMFSITNGKWCILKSCK